MTYSHRVQAILDARVAAARDVFLSALVSGIGEAELDHLRAQKVEVEQAAADYWHSDTAVVLEPPADAVQAYLADCGGLDGGGEF